MKTKNLINHLADTMPSAWNQLAEMRYGFIKHLKDENLLPLSEWSVRDKATQIVIAEFICIDFSWAYITKRMENICRARGLNPEYFEIG